MLFLQGTRDEFARLDLLREVVTRLGDRATLHLIEEGDHSFKVPKRTGMTEIDVMLELAHSIETWSKTLSPLVTDA
jgi:predicted alpha/beta-hydrolase family hydrolase